MISVEFRRVRWSSLLAVFRWLRMGCGDWSGVGCLNRVSIWGLGDVIVYRVEFILQICLQTLLIVALGWKSVPHP